MPQERIFSFIATAKDIGQRLDTSLAALLQDQGFSRERIKQAIKNSQITINRQICTIPKTSLSFGDEIIFRIPNEQPALIAVKGELAILYKDNNLAIINKPVGLTMHPCPSCQDTTLAHQLLHDFPELQLMPGDRPGIVHRLDKDTSGLLLIALSEHMRLVLAELFAARAIEKTYLALVHGVPRQRKGQIDAPIGRHPQKKTCMAVTASGKNALSFWEVLYSAVDGRFSLLAVNIPTGRTHQIRVHLAHIGHPIIGDLTYGSRPDQLFPLLSSGQKTASANDDQPTKNKEQHEKLTKKQPTIPAALAHSKAGTNTWLEMFPALQTALAKAEHQLLPTQKMRPMLHAWHLAFNHPQPPKSIPELSNIHVSGTRFDIFCSPPQDFLQTFAALGTNTQRLVVTGSPGCGKSTLLALFSALGIPCISADSIVRDLYQKNNPGWELIQARFGERFLDAAHGVINKQLLFQAMQDEPSIRQELEALIHPLVYNTIEAFWNNQAQRRVAFALAEIPLYLETGHRFLHHAEKKAAQQAFLPTPAIIGIHCPLDIREARLVENRHWTKKTIQTMESWQWPEKQKMQACNIVLDNSRGIPELIQQLPEIMHILLELQAKQLPCLERLLHDKTGSLLKNGKKDETAGL